MWFCPCVAFGFGCSPFAVVPRGGGFVCPQPNFAFDVGPSARAALSLVRVFGSCLVLVVVLRVGLRRFAFAVVSFHLFFGTALRVGWSRPKSGEIAW